MEITESLLRRFWQRVPSSDADTCWEWQGALRAGYGCMKHNHKVINCHRLSFIIHHGPIPQGLIVGHKCDNRRCVNPHHLEAITYAQNNYDGAHRGREKRGVTAVRGSECYNAVLNEEIVSKIKRMRAEAWIGPTQLSAMFGVSKHAIKQVIAGKTWKHVS